ncbi:MAG: cytochrome P450, partial [Acidobacteriota bacterium]|nr:cytochrome P450 [Acidobacteriota bacterium]
MQQADRHAKLREALHPGLALIHQPSFQDAIRLRVEGIVAELPSGGSFDLVQNLAAPLPVAVIADVLGVSSAGLLALQAEAETLSLFLSGEDSPSIRARVLEASERLWAHFSSAQASPGGLLDELRRGELSPNEAVAQSVLVFLAGHQTLRDAICAVVVALSEFPEYQTAVRDGTLSTARVVEEALRLDSPVQVAGG